MSQFAVYANPRASVTRAPFVVDLQSNLVDMSVRVHAPLVKIAYYGIPMERLNPIFELESQQLVLSPAEMTAVLIRDLGSPVASVSDRRDDILAALDFLFTGI